MLTEAVYMFLAVGRSSSGWCRSDTLVWLEDLLRTDLPVSQYFMIISGAGDIPGVPPWENPNYSKIVDYPQSTRYLAARFANLVFDLGRDFHRSYKLYDDSEEAHAYRAAQVAWIAENLPTLRDGVRASEQALVALQDRSALQSEEAALAALEDYLAVGRVDMARWCVLLPLVMREQEGASGAGSQAFIDTVVAQFYEWITSGAIVVEQGEPAAEEAMLQRYQELVAGMSPPSAAAHQHSKDLLAWLRSAIDSATTYEVDKALYNIPGRMGGSTPAVRDLKKFGEQLHLP